MKNRKYLKILLGIVITVLLIVFLTTLLVKPWVRNKIGATFNEKNSDYIVTIDKVKTSIIPSAIELEGIEIRSKKDYSGIIDLNGKIRSIKIKGINLAKAIVKKDVSIRKIIISESHLSGKISSPRDTIIPIVLPLNMQIDIVHFDKINLLVESTANAASYSFTVGVLRLYDVHAEKQDTLSPEIIKQYDFEAEKLITVSSDGMHSFDARGIIYSAASNTLAIKSFSVHPNYTDYEFTSRYEYQRSRIEADFSNIHVYDFNIADYLRSGSLISSWTEIGRMDMKVFRDKRKELRHANMRAFQDVIYDYPGNIHIDSIGLINGNITYTDHAEEANEPGSISFNEINAKIYNITNNTIYKTKSAFLELKGDALLMGKGRMTIFLKSRLFDIQNTFTLDGTLSDLEANELNPILEKSAFIYATSGKIDEMNFSFTANSTRATGKMTLLYHGLYIAVKNKQTDDTTAFRERFISLIANKRILDSNPVRDKDVREGIIDFQRDPERFLFHYCFRSILSGIQSSLQKSPDK